MKNTFPLALSLGLLLSLSACEKDEVKLESTMSPAPALTASKTNAGVLLSANAAAPAVVYTWTPVTFSLPDGSKPVIPVTYTLEFAQTGTNFAAPGTVSAGSNASTATVNTADLNTALVKAGLTPTKAGTVDVRLRSSYAGNQSDVFSGVSQLTATPYSLDLFLFGSSFGSLSASSVSLRERAGQPAQFEGYVYAPNATNTFKLSNTSSAAGTVFGAGATNSDVSSAASATEFALTGPKMYRVRVDLANNKLTTDATQWGVIGAATTGDGTGWNQSVPMTYNVKNKVWELLNVNMPGASGGDMEFKFRANDEWKIDLGESKTTKGVSKLEEGGDILKTSGAGRYDITLDLNNPDKYTYSITKK